MEYTDWLLKNEDSIVAEEDLDKPYAFYGRVYTRREFEQVRDRAAEAKQRADMAEKEEEANNEALFFENFDYIMENSDRILANKELADSNPISFAILIPWVGGTFPTLGAKVQGWKEGGKRECPVCGEPGYFISVCSHREKIYCPHCKNIISAMERRSDRESRVGVIVQQRAQRRKEAEEEKLNTDKTAEEKKIQEQKIELQGKISAAKNEDMDTVHSFKEVYKLWDKTEHTPHEKFVANARLGVAQMHGESIRKWLCETEENEKRFQEYEEINNGHKPSKTEKLLARIKELNENESKITKQEG